MGSSNSRSRRTSAGTSGYRWMQGSPAVAPPFVRSARVTRPNCTRLDERRRSRTESARYLPRTCRCRRRRPSPSRADTAASARWQAALRRDRRSRLRNAVQMMLMHDSLLMTWPLSDGGRFDQRLSRAPRGVAVGMLRCGPLSPSGSPRTAAHRFTAHHCLLSVDRAREACRASVPAPCWRRTSSRKASISRREVMCVTRPEVTCSTRPMTRRGGWARASRCSTKARSGGNSSAGPGVVRAAIGAISASVPWRRRYGAALPRTMERT